MQLTRGVNSQAFGCFHPLEGPGVHALLRLHYHELGNHREEMSSYGEMKAGFGPLGHLCRHSQDERPGNKLVLSPD